MLRTPIVSILIAARNEERNIRNCLQSVLNQSYPVNDYEVLIGNDSSSDNTAGVVRQIQLSNSNIQLLDITESLNGLVGKANVLAQLAKLAKGQLILVTDADVVVGRTWIESFINEMGEDAEMASGVVSLTGNELFSQLQNADWIHYLFSCYKKSERGKPVTALGGNMAIKTYVYHAVGEYENIPFSVTEDFELFRCVTQSGFRYKSIFSKDTLVYTGPVENFGQLLKQRKRWLTSSVKRNWFSKVEFNLNSLYLPVLLLSGIAFSWWITIFAVLFFWAYDIYFLALAFRKLQLQLNKGALFHAPYAMICNFIYLFFVFDRRPVEWKGRIY